MITTHTRQHLYLQTMHLHAVHPSTTCFAPPPGQTFPSNRAPQCRHALTLQTCAQQRQHRLITANAAVLGGKVYLDPAMQEASAYAPATVANLGPGFDWMGCAVQVSNVSIDVDGSGTQRVVNTRAMATL